VVGIGLSAGFIEPLESNGLFSVHEFLFKLIDILQRKEISQFDRNMYNVSVRNLFDNFSKFVALHYALSHRDDTLYWKNISQKDFKDPITNDPYVLSRSNTFYDMIWRYMENQEHPLTNAGITYIATGMNVRMFNSARLQDIEFRLGVDTYKLAQNARTIFDAKQKRWKEAAKKSPTLHDYLKDVFYNND